jgi:hypothetical protein
MHTLNKLFFALLIIAFSVSINAALITSTGTNVQFTFDDALLALFGTPVVSGDALYGHDLGALALNETGTYIREGENAGVAVTGSLNAINLNNAASTYVSNIMPTTPLSETVFDSPVSIWTAKANFNLLSDTTSLLVNIDSILRANIFSGANGSEKAYIG